MNHQLQNLDSRYALIRTKIEAGERITNAEGIWLFEEADTGFLSSCAQWIRKQKNGNRVWFNRNFHIEPTNLCVYTCSFCSYSRLIKQKAEGWEYTLEQMCAMVRQYSDTEVTEVHIVGGVLPQYHLEFYERLFREIKNIAPKLHIKALTPVEFYYIFKKAKVSFQEGLERLRKAGLDSIPGGGAEIFHEDVRSQICPDKCGAEDWLFMHKIWHGMGMRSNATILYGHIENYHHRIDHLDRLRTLQDTTGGFQTFIPLKFRNQDNAMSHIPEVSIIEDMRMYAVSRIYLDNFDHIKAYWPMLGRHNAQLSLQFGVDDLDGTIDDTTRIYSMAGSEEQNPAMTTQQLVELIRQAGYAATERDTHYHVLHDDSYFPVEVDSGIRTYFELPVQN